MMVVFPHPFWPRRPYRRPMVSSIVHLANKDYAALVDDFIKLEILPADCNRGKFAEAGSPCEECAAGTYAAIEGSETCDVCEPGKKSIAASSQPASR